MASSISGFEYDIFISYRHNDNRSGWVSEFVKALQEELAATIKDPVSVYFDTNPHDGLLESHNVDKSLERKLKCLIFIPILSQTYCDTKSFAWQHEFCAFHKLAKADRFGTDVMLSNGNIASRILPIKIHDLDPADKVLVENELGEVLRAIEFIYKTGGVNRPLRVNEDNPQDNLNKTYFRDQINKTANAVKGILEGLKTSSVSMRDQAENKETSDTRNLTTAIQEKDLLKVGLVYTIVSLLLWKITDLAVTLFSLPPFVANWVASVLAVLFPVAILLAWKYERAPGGFIRSNSPAAKTNPLSNKQRKPLTSNTAILTLLVAMLLLYFVPQKFFPPASGAGQPIENKSIAVLYFDNMSGDAAQDFMSDGLTEEIITRLTKIDGLRVISRTSVRVYKGQPLNLKKIASDLNVSIVLEGSVRKSGNQLRVTAQLINADTDEHLWAESFDRELKDVFEVQTEIAQVIAEKFRIQLTPEQNLKVNAISTPNTDAYETYLKARHIAFNEYYHIGDSVAFVRSKGLYEKAIDMDPDFALALAGLADLYDAYRSLNYNRFTPEMDSIRNTLSWKAYTLDPNSAFVNNVRIWMLMNRNESLLDSALYHARRAIQLEPNDYYNYESMGALFAGYNTGLFEVAMAFYEKAIDMNPLDPANRTTLAQCYYLTGALEKGDREFQAAYDLAPNKRFLGANWVMWWLIQKGRLDEAEKMRLEIIKKHPQSTYNGILARILIARGKTQEALKLMPNIATNPEVLCELKRYDEAVEAIKKFGMSSDYYLYLLNNPGFKVIHNKPEIQDILAEQRKLHETNLAKYRTLVAELIN